MIVALIHLAATAMMCGLIWFVQVVHYPLFAAVGGDRRVSYAERHQRRTTLVVGPLMLLEAVTAVWLTLVPPVGVDLTFMLAGLACLAAVWLSTAFVQVPEHARLSDHRTEDARVRSAVRRLVWTNWIRTVLWTLRTVLAAVIVLHAAA